MQLTWSKSIVFYLYLHFDLFANYGFINLLTNIILFMGSGKLILEHKIVIIFISISLNIWFGSSKNNLIETVLLSTHTICCCWEI